MVARIDSHSNPVAFMIILGLETRTVIEHQTISQFLTSHTEVLTSSKNNGQ